MHRAFHLTSTYVAFHREIEFLKSFFAVNGFNMNMYFSIVRKFLNNIYQPRLLHPTVRKQRIYVSLPYLGDLSEKIEAHLKKSLSKFFPQVDFQFVFVNNYRIKSFFRFKDQLPSSIMSSVVYKFNCPNCQVGYFGSTFRALKVRIDEHIGQSSRTGRPISNPSHSEIRDHSEICKFNLNPSHFNIVDSCSDNFSLRVLESLYIRKNKPVLNSLTSATPLYTLD